MNEPKRWLDDGAHPLIAQALRAAGDEQPPPGSLSRALASVAVGAGITSVASGAAGAASSTGIFLKWTLVGCAITLGTAGAGLGLGALADQPAPREGPAVARSAAPVVAPELALSPRSPPEHVVPSKPAASEGVAAAPSSRAGPPTGRSSANAAAPLEVPLEDVDLLAQETRLIERARAESAAGRHGAALAVLDEYDRRFSPRRYAPEALYLRMEALVGLGQHAAARQVAAQLAARYPNSPHAARAELVRGAQIP